jgi:hypothetical protein
MCIVEIDTFSNTGPHNFLMCPVELNMATISGTTHIKTIFSFCEGTGSVPLVMHSATVKIMSRNSITFYTFL